MTWVASTGGTCDAMVDFDERIKQIRAVIGSYGSRLERAQRLYLSDSSPALASIPEIEFQVRKTVSQFFQVPLRKVAFAGSAQLGVSVHKGRSFLPGESDLDIACVDGALFTRAWMDVIDVTRAFTDESGFPQRGTAISRFKDQLLRRAMIRVAAMPTSDLSTSWRRFEDSLTLQNLATFKRVSVAIYPNEQAFCWKQDSAIQLLRGVS